MDNTPSKHFFKDWCNEKRSSLLTKILPKHKDGSRIFFALHWTIRPVDTYGEAKGRGYIDRHFCPYSPEHGLFSRHVSYGLESYGGMVPIGTYDKETNSLLPIEVDEESISFEVVYPYRRAAKLKPCVLKWQRKRRKREFRILS